MFIDTVTHLFQGQSYSSLICLLFFVKVLFNIYSIPNFYLRRNNFRRYWQWLHTAWDYTNFYFKNYTIQETNKLFLNTFLSKRSSVYKLHFLLGINHWTILHFRSVVIIMTSTVLLFFLEVFCLCLLNIVNIFSLLRFNNLDYFLSNAIACFN